MGRARLSIAITSVMIVCACAGPSPTAQATPSAPAAQTTPASTPSASPLPSSPPAASRLVITPSRDNKLTLIQDYADPYHPKTRYSLNLPASNVRFISANEISYRTNSSPSSPYDGVTTIWRMSLKDRRPVSVARLQGDALDFTWSPDGLNLAVVTYANIHQQAVNRLWLKVRSAGPRALNSTTLVYGRDTTGSDQVTVRFSADGRYLLMVDTLVAGRAPKPVDQAHFQVRSVPDGKLVWVPANVLKGSWTTMAAWSHAGDQLYYDDPVSASGPPAGIQRWDAPAHVSTLARGVIWYSPSISLNDQFVAYQVDSQTNGQPSVEVRNLVSGSVVKLSGAQFGMPPEVFGAPVFLSDEWMLVDEFVKNTQGFGPAYVPSGQYFVLHWMDSGFVELKGRFRPYDVWPR
jgi:hypothetical protein